MNRWWAVVGGYHKDRIMVFLGHQNCSPPDHCYYLYLLAMGNIELELFKGSIKQL